VCLLLPVALKLGQSIAGSLWPGHDHPPEIFNLTQKVARYLTEKRSLFEKKVGRHPGPQPELLSPTAHVLSTSRNGKKFFAELFFKKATADLPLSYALDRFPFMAK
jgi:hypothetical protein